MDGRAYDKLSDGKLIGIFNRTDRMFFAETISSAQISMRILLIFAEKIVIAFCICMEYNSYETALS